MKVERLYHMAIDANLAPRERVYQNVVRRHCGTPKRNARRAALIAVACLALAIAAVACIPGARAAVLNWLRPAVDPGDYLNTPAGRRQGVPALDGAIESAADKPLTITVTDAVNGQWQTWAERLSVEFGEILYDGEMIYVTGTLYGNTGDFVKPEDEYIIQEESEQGILRAPPGDLIFCTTYYSVNEGEFQNTRRSALSSLVLDPHEVGAFVSGGAVPISLTLAAEKGLTGTQQLTLAFGFVDFAAVRAAGESADASEMPRVKLRVEGLTFDATVGTEANSALPGTTSAALTGGVLVFSKENQRDGTALVGNDRLSLDGGTLSLLHMQQQLGGTAMTLCITLPESWSDAQCRFISDRISVDFVIDGENQGGIGQAYKGIQYHDDSARPAAPGNASLPDMTDFHNLVFTIEAGLLPDDWQRIDSLALLLCVDELTAFNHVSLPADGRVRVALERDGWSEDTQTRRFTECPLIVRREPS